jgi:transposase
MNTSYCDCGIDVSKETLDLHVHQTQTARQFSNTAQGHSRMIAYLKSINARRIVLEATGGYERPVTIAMVNAGLAVHVAQPQATRYFARSLNIKAKTDRIDGRLLARYAHERQDLRMIPKIDMKIESLHALVARRDQLVEMETMEENRLQQASDKATIKSIKRVQGALARAVKAVEKEIDQAIDADAALAAKARKIDETKGVGRQTARVLVACLPELGSSTPRALNALVGVAPYADDSGKYHGRRHIAGGRQLVRNALYMACMSARVSNRVIAPHYQSMIKRGLPHKTAMMACIRKMLAHLEKEVRSLAPLTTQAA